MVNVAQRSNRWLSDSISSKSLIQNTILFIIKPLILAFYFPIAKALASALTIVSSSAIAISKGECCLIFWRRS
jgi:hypothetical protein